MPPCVVVTAPVTPGCAVAPLADCRYNVWFEPTEQHARWAALMGIIKAGKPRAICFQEVTAPFLTQILALEWVRERECLKLMRGSAPKLQQVQRSPLAFPPRRRLPGPISVDRRPRTRHSRRGHPGVVL